MEVTARTRLLVIVLALAGCGCSAGPMSGYVWVHATKTPQEYYADSLKCASRANDVSESWAVPGTKDAQRSARSSGSGPAPSASGDIRVEMHRKTTFRKCMMTSGWYQARKQDIVSSHYRLGEGKSAFEYDRDPIFSIEYPRGSVRVPIKHPDQVFAAKTVEGVEFSASVSDTPPGVTMDRWAEEYVRTLELSGIASGAKVTTNMEITLRDGTRAYRSEVRWFHKPSRITLRTQTSCAYRDGKAVFIVVHAGENPESFIPIVESLRFN